MTSEERLPACSAVDGALRTVLLLTGVETTRSTLLSVLCSVGDCYTESVRGFFEVSTANGAALVATVCRNVTPLEASEVRAVVLDGQEGSELLAAAMAAPTLSRMTNMVDTSIVESLLPRAINGTATGVTIVDARLPNMPIIFVNESFRKITGFLESEVLGKNCRFLQGPDTDREAVRSARAALEAETDHVNLLLNYRKDGTTWWNELRLSPVRDSDGTLTHYFGFQSDVTARVEAEREVARLATHDPLTGLPNRSGFLAGLNGHLADATRSGGQVAVLFIDLDGFKDVNDSLGHEVGDRVLAIVADRLRQSLRPADLLGRLSGDEFVASIPDIDIGGDIVHRVSTDVLGAFSGRYDVDGNEITIGASIGVALFPDHGRTAAELIRAADTAMYAAKNNGGGRAVMALPPVAPPG